MPNSSPLLYIPNSNTCIGALKGALLFLCAERAFIPACRNINRGICFAHSLLNDILHKKHGVHELPNGSKVRA